MVPTATRFGRLFGWIGWAGWVLLRVSLVTKGDYGLSRAKVRTSAREGANLPSVPDARHPVRLVS